MKKAVIWDLDGTLLDSYGVIVESIYLVFQEFCIPTTRHEIHHHVIEFSTKSLFRKTAQQHGLPAEHLQQRYSQISGSKYQEITLMHHAVEVLQKLSELGIENYVFTHRGKTTVPVLENLNLTCFFREVLTSQSGFARKPDPEAIRYLIDKYELEPENTWYAGDRSLDMECAKNASIKGMLYLPPGSIDVSGGEETVVVHDLLDILQIV